MIYNKHMKEAWGEIPPNIEHIPGEIEVDQVPGGDSEEKGKQYLKEHRTLVKSAKEEGKNLISIRSNRGLQIIVGTAFAIGAIGTGVVLYEANKRKNKGKKK